MISACGRPFPRWEARCSIRRADQNIVLSQDLCGLVLAVGVVGGVLADVDLTGLAGQPDADLIDREVTGSVADGAEDAAPVGVAAKDRGLEEVGADHAAADGAGRLEVGGVDVYKRQLLYYIRL